MSSQEKQFSGTLSVRRLFGGSQVFGGLLFRALVCYAMICCASVTAAEPFPELPPDYAQDSELREDASLHAVAFASPSLGIAVGDRGTILRTDDGGSSWTLIDSDVWCRLDDVLWINQRQAIVVGGAYDRVTGVSRGVTLRTIDSGKTWQRGDDAELPRLRKLSLRSQDRAIVALGDWGAASLSREYESHDRGRSWANSGELDGRTQLPADPSVRDFANWTKLARVNTPIRDVCRLDGSTLCAVGDHGVITTSVDSGKTWTSVRGQQRRTSVVFIADSPATAPWPLIGSEALESRQRVFVLFANCPETASDPAKGRPIDVARQATVMLGAAGADVLGIDAQGTDAQETDAQEADTALEDWLVVHQPSVVVFDQSLSTNLQSSITQTSIRKGVPRVVSCSFGGRGESMLHSGAILPSTGVLVRDLWQDALHLVAPNRQRASSIALRHVHDSVSSARQGPSITAGLGITVPQTLNARSEPASRRQLQIVQARLSQPQLIANLMGESKTASEYATNLGALLDQTAADDRLRLAWSVLQAIRASASDVELHQQTLDEIANRFAESSLGKWAELRSQSLRNSVEWARLRQALPSQLVRNDTQVAKPAEIVPVSPFQPDISRVVQASVAAPIQVPKAGKVKFKSDRETSQIDLSWEFHPLVLVARDAATKRGDNGKLTSTSSGSANLRRLAANRNAQQWRELLSATPIVARLAHQPPKLNGELDDECWMAAALANGATPAKVAYDEQYVYFAIQCRADRLRTDDFVRDETTPPRDHELVDVDRFRLSLDVDRDLLTAMHLTMTDAGRTRDCIDQYAYWDPTWYVAPNRSNGMLTFEIAIRRRDVTDLPIVPGESWFLSASPVDADSSPEQVLPNVAKWTRVVFQ